MSIDPRGQELGDRITPAWAQVARPAHSPGARIHWYPALSAPLPASWPPRGDGLIVWVYARAMDEQLHDGERVSTPWARLSIRAPGAAPVLELLPEEIADLGVQGVRPLGPGEPRMLPMSEAERVLFEVVSRASIGTPSEATKTAWCAWIRANGVIADALGPSNRGFFEWLGCP